MEVAIKCGNSLDGVDPAIKEKGVQYFEDSPFAYAGSDHSDAPQRQGWIEGKDSARVFAPSRKVLYITHLSTSNVLFTRRNPASAAAPASPSGLSDILHKQGWY